MISPRRALRSLWLIPVALVAAASVAWAQEAEQRRLVHTRVLHASPNWLGQEAWLDVWHEPGDPTLALLRTKLTRFPYRHFALLQNVTYALAVNERGEVMLPNNGGSIEIMPTGFAGQRMRMQIRLVPASLARPIELSATSNPRGTVVIGGVPHATGTLMILIQQQPQPTPQQQQAAAGSIANTLFQSPQQY